MNSNDEISVRKSFSGLFDSIDNSDKLEVETRLLMYRFLSEIEIITASRGITRKKLASMIGTSASYLTQLYKGDKIINLRTIAKIERALDLRFKVTLFVDKEVPNSQISDEKTKVEVSAVSLGNLLKVSAKGTTKGTVLSAGHLLTSKKQTPDLKRRVQKNL